MTALGRPATLRGLIIYLWQMRRLAPSAGPKPWRGLFQINPVIHNSYFTVSSFHLLNPRRIASPVLQLFFEYPYHATTTGYPAWHEKRAQAMSGTGWQVKGIMQAQPGAVFEWAFRPYRVTDCAGERHINYLG
jgi:hypothetical protein